MTINEAIKHAEKIACGNDQCAKDHAQLAYWLRELRQARMKINLLKTLRDEFEADAQRYKAENAKLREFVYYMWNDMNVYYTQHESPDSSDMDFYCDSMRELGVEVPTRRCSDD